MRKGNIHMEKYKCDIKHINVCTSIWIDECMVSFEKETNKTSNHKNKVQTFLSRFFRFFLWHLQIWPLLRYFNWEHIKQKIGLEKYSFIHTNSEFFSYVDKYSNDDVNYKWNKKIFRFSLWSFAFAKC